MKVIFELNLPDDQHEYDIIHQASRVQSVLWQFSQTLREYEKYGNYFKDTKDAVVKIREEFHRLINNYQVNIDL